MSWPKAESPNPRNPADRVALLSASRYEWTLIDYAIWSIGAITVPIYETSSVSQVQWTLTDSEAVVAVVENGPSSPRPSTRAARQVDVELVLTKLEGWASVHARSPLAAVGLKR
ncbi:AMP-binding protein [Streptomyces sp. SID13031]|uniref:AMP-binding protein n=1 Tax=Streptomyces sp. SID13031 TaxID=2706046 RepID=UPI0013CA0218|nr:long-chain fatty acid--CoA ligase [Streptomyces sp. SID13031]